MSTGDLKNNIKKLQTQIKAVKYTGKLDLDGLKDGSPTAYLPLYHYVFTSYSNKLNRDISNSNNELYGKSDLRFIEAVYKILRDMFSYKPPVTREQFFLPGFAERKVIMATDILRHIHSVYNPPSSHSSYKLASKLEKKHKDLYSKVQAENQNENKLQAKPRKVAGKSVVDLTEAIVLPRYISTSHTRWMEANSASNSNNITPLSESAMERDPTPHQTQSASPLPTSPVGESDASNDRTLQFTEHITKALTMLSTQVGKISIALEKVESRVAATESPRVQPPAEKVPSQLDKLQMDTLISKVVLLENRMTILENKVDDIQSFCTILLENQTRSKERHNSVTNIHDATQEEEDAVVAETSGMHPSYVKAFAPVADTATGRFPSQNPDRQSTREDTNAGQTIRLDQQVVERDNGDDLTIEDVISEDVVDHATPYQATAAKMKFMKTLVGANESEISLTGEQADSSCVSQDSKTRSTTVPYTNKLPKPKSSRVHNDRDFDSDFSPIRGHKDSSLLREDDSLIHIPCAGVDEGDYYKSHRLSSTPNKADLDSSTISRVHRIMHMMKETQEHFESQNS